MTAKWTLWDWGKGTSQRSLKQAWWCIEDMRQPDWSANGFAIQKLGALWLDQSLTGWDLERIRGEAIVDHQHWEFKEEDELDGGALKGN